VRDNGSQHSSDVRLGGVYRWMSIIVSIQCHSQPFFKSYFSQFFGLVLPICLMILCTPIPIIFSPWFSTWGFHSHFVGVRYSIKDPLGGTLFALAHLCVLCPTIVAHPTCIFPFLADDTHMVSFALDVVPMFLWLHEELSTLGLLV
jgi:hypothetical protein